MYVTHRYTVTPQLRAELESKTPVFGFNGFGEATYFRTYSRQKSDGTQESWADTVIRVVEGVLSIRKDWYVKHGLPVDEDKLNDYANRLGHAIFDMKMLPPGRGLWTMGTDYVFERGSMALNNCAYCEVKKLSVDMNWAMDALMCGVGVGFGVYQENSQELTAPDPKYILEKDWQQNTKRGGILVCRNGHPTYIIPDTREGWVESLEILLQSYEDKMTAPVSFDYSQIRPYGSAINGFGGKASGPEPLIKLHNRVRLVCDRYVAGDLSWTRLCADISNSIGACVVAGNVRRCLPEGTNVHTIDGWKTIENVTVGDVVYTSIGPKPVTKFFEQGEQKTLIIETTHGELECTPNHRVAVISDDFKWSYKMAKDLNKNDFLVYDNSFENIQDYLDENIEYHSKYEKSSILNVKPGRSVETYDIEVEDAHHFTANGFVVHNSAEILLGNIDDSDFINLKNYDEKSDYILHDGEAIYQCTEFHISSDSFENDPYWQLAGNVATWPEDKMDLLKEWKPNTFYDGRSALGWMSNNTVRLDRKPEFRQMPKISKLITSNGEPGIMNFTNVKEHARYGDLREDTATGCNPCSEIPLESYELCNLSEVFPTRCKTKAEFYEALELASFYSSTVSLLPTHREETNEVVNRNHRIGVSISGIADWFDAYGAADCIPMMRKGYKIVRKVNAELAKEAGIPESIRVSTVKPSGCWEKDSLLCSNRGFLKFDEIVADDSLNDPYNEETWQSVNDVEVETRFGERSVTLGYDNGVSETKVIETADGFVSEVSLNHPLLVQKDSGQEFVKAKDLKVGDSLVSRLGYYKKSTETALKPLKIEGDGREKAFNGPDIMSPNLAFLLGLYYGDGSNHSKGIRIAMNAKHSDLICRIGAISKDLFGIEPTYEERGGYYVAVCLNSVNLLKWLDVNNLTKDKASYLQIPREIRCSSRESIIQFIGGVWRADGGIHQSSWSICTISETFARQLIVLCRGVGYNVKLRNSGPGGIGFKDRWVVHCRIFEESNMRYLSKDLKSRILGDDYWLDPITSLKDSVSHTKDVKVERDHEYIANSFVSHNTISQLAGVSSGMHFPTFQYAIRRMRVSEGSELVPVLQAAGVPWEKDVYSDNTLVFEFPIDQGKTRPANQVSAWEQFALLSTLQREWADNMVSCTIYFDPNTEGDQLEHMLGQFTPTIKSVSLLPHTDTGAYAQMPYEGITKEEYDRRLSEISTIDWSTFGGSDGQDSVFCTNDSCSIVPTKS